MKTIAALEARLGELHQRTRETPLFNPVFQLSLDLSRALEGDALTLDDLSALVTELECDGLKARAGKLRALLAPPPQPVRLAGEGEDFEAFAARWERPQLHAVFTAHPTFLLAPAQAEAVAAAASGDDDAAACAVPSARTAVTLNHEHRAAMDAMARAQDARDVIVARLLEDARKRWPQDWRALRPLPFRFASWVGYDMDGRTDIGWHTSIAFRLQEKAERLARYTASLDGIDPAHPLLDTLRPAAAFAAARAEDFSADLSSAEALAAAANRLTTHSADNLLSLAALIAALETEAETADPARAVRLLTLAAAMRADGLGMGWMHFRVNAKQLHNAMRRRLARRRGDRSWRARARSPPCAGWWLTARPLRANFAALATESSTAIRQFLAMAADPQAHRRRRADPDAGGRVRTACHGARRALFREAVRDGGQGRCLAPVRDRDRAGTWRQVARRAAQPSRPTAPMPVSVAEWRSRPGSRTRAVRRAESPPALAIERLQGRLAEAMASQRPVRRCRARLQHPRRKHGPRQRIRRRCATGSNGRSPLGRGGGLRDAGVAAGARGQLSGRRRLRLFFATPELALATLSRIAANFRPRDRSRRATPTRSTAAPI
jgi:phosphoenolpyruvate carboxylase